MSDNSVKGVLELNKVLKCFRNVCHALTVEHSDSLQVPVVIGPFGLVGIQIRMVHSYVEQNQVVINNRARHVHVR